MVIISSPYRLANAAPRVPLRLTDTWSVASDGQPAEGWARVEVEDARAPQSPTPKSAQAHIHLTCR
jgi:hypothetical protein